MTAIMQIMRSISIHALHEESDFCPILPTVNSIVISIHALHEESDAEPLFTAIKVGFQSTLSMRRATRPRGRCNHRRSDFNPRSP